MKRKLRFLLGIVATVSLVSATTADAAVIINNFVNVAPAGGAVHDPHDPSSTGTPDLLSASSSDLVQGQIATVTYTGGSGSTTHESSTGESAWTNGSLSTVYAETGDGSDAIDHAAYGTVTATVGGSDIDAFVTYDLGGIYFLSRVDVFMGWNDSGRDDSSFNLLVSNNGVDYSSIAMYDKGSDNTGQSDTPLTNLQSIVDDGGGNIASGVQFVQLQFTDADNGFAGMVEVDVFGVQVPEPSTLALVGLLGLATVAMRRNFQIFAS